MENGFSNLFHSRTGISVLVCLPRVLPCFSSLITGSIGILPVLRNLEKNVEIKILVRTHIEMQPDSRKNSVAAFMCPNAPLQHLISSHLAQIPIRVSREECSRDNPVSVRPRQDCRGYSQLLT